MPIYYKAIITIKSRLNMCPRCRKAVKFTSGLTKYINVYKILIALSSWLFLKSKQVLKYNNISYLLDILSNNNKKNFGPANINKQNPVALSNCIP